MKPRRCIRLLQGLKRDWADWLTAAGILIGLGLTVDGLARNDPGVTAGAANLLLGVPLLRGQLERNRRRKDDEQ